MDKRRGKGARVLKAVEGKRYMYIFKKTYRVKYAEIKQFYIYKAGITVASSGRHDNNNSIARGFAPYSKTKSKRPADVRRTMVVQK